MVKVDETCDVSPVHKLVSFELPLERERKQKKISFRLKANFKPETLIVTMIDTLTLKQHENCMHEISYASCTTCLTRFFNDTLKQLYVSQWPLIKKEITIKDHAPRFNGIILNAKREKRKNGLLSELIQLGLHTMRRNKKKRNWLYNGNESITETR